MALEDAEKSKTKVRLPKPKPSPMFNHRNIFDHVLLHVKAIRNSEIENTLRFLNFKQSVQLLYYLEHNIRNVKIALLIIENRTWNLRCHPAVPYSSWRHTSPRFR